MVSNEIVVSCCVNDVYSVQFIQVVFFIVCIFPSGCVLKYCAWVGQILFSYLVQFYF